MSDSLNETEALNLLKKAGCEPGVIKHCIAVSRNAVNIAGKIREAGHKVDIDFIRVAGLLHDIGRSRTHGIMHGVEGARILEGYPKYARVCETHIGAGLTKEEATELGLPSKDYIPKTLEEKIIAHADNLIDHDKMVPFEEALGKFKKRLGADHPGIKRIIELNDYINSLLD